MIAGTYNPGLVALSVLIAIVASYAAFNLGERVAASGGPRRWMWLTSGAVAMGCAIWSMHYVGTLAFVLPVPVEYHVPTVLLSLVAAVAGSAVALVIVSKKDMRRVDRAIAGFSLGSAISSMHYIGMAAMRSTAMHHYNPALVTLSIIVAITFSFVAAWLAFRFGRSHQTFMWTKVAAASLMGVGIASMHYTAMAAAYFTVGFAPPTRLTVAVSSLGAFGIGMTTLLLLGTVLATSWIDRRLARERLLQDLYDALQQSEAYLTEAQQLAHTGSWAANFITKEGIYSSEEYLRLYGFDPGTQSPRFEEFLERVHPEDRDRLTATLEAASRAATDVDVQFRIVIPGGGIRNIHSRGHPVSKPSARPGSYFGIAMDVTERKRADEERERLREAQAHLAHVTRVTTMGELTASVAHEVKQPISAALTDARTCLRWLARDQPDMAEAREAASRVVRDITHAADIIGRIGSLFKKETAQRELLDLNGVIREMIALLRSEASRYSIAIVGQLANDLPKTIADRVQLQQVLMNLMLNGIEAMKDSTRAGQLTIRSRGENGHILISVSDTGSGIPPDQAEHIFEAFFTTKVHGTGVGLTISRSIVESHGGRLWATGHAGPGATFLFTLPSEGAVA